MKITILAYGSRGDVQPFLPLSIRLMEAGHSVKLAAPSRFENLVGENGIPFVPLSGDPEDLSRRLNNAGKNSIKLLSEMLGHTTRVGREIWHQADAACRDADVILHTFLHAIGGHTLARENNIPDLHIQTFPMFTSTGDYPNVTWPNWNIRSLNRLTHRIAAKTTWWTSQIGFARVRRSAGLTGQKLYWPFDRDTNRPPTPILCAWSPTVLPASTDWPPQAHVTGYYFFPRARSYQPPEALTSFLQRGEPPVCITFGSMVNRDKERIDRIVCDALRQTGNRGIILSGWSGVSNSAANDLLYLESVPHDWLLPQCKMVVHHGGAGTTAAGLRAGIPNVVIPFMGDQPFWAERVHTIHAGPMPITVKGLSVKRLCHAISEANASSIRESAQSIGGMIHGEDGTWEAVQWIEKYSNDFHK